jgi:hypothetical protein
MAPNVPKPPAINLRANQQFSGKHPVNNIYITFIDEL